MKHIHGSFGLAAAVAAVALVVAPLAGVGSANETGPLSGTARVGCGSGCHGDARNPEIGIVAPETTDGSPTPLPIHVSVEDDAVTGGGGFMLEASSGRIDFEPDSGMRRRGPNEATHDGSQPWLRSWSVSWTADGPITGCAVEVLVAAMAVNLDGEPEGDSWGRRTVWIALDPTGDVVSPAAPVFHAPVSGDVVYEGNRVAIASARTSLIVVYGSAEFRIGTSDDRGLRDVVLYDVDPLGAETPIGTAALDPDGGQWRLSWSTAGVLPGPHRIRAVATDCAGNSSATNLDLLAF